MVAWLAWTESGGECWSPAVKVARLIVKAPCFGGRPLESSKRDTKGDNGYQDVC